MFVAICSRAPGQEAITADEAYHKVWRIDDWGYIQNQDGWICPECRQPVFLKGPHERIGKAYSYVVKPHFCHHSVEAALSCALFRAGRVNGQNQADAIYTDRRQSLRRFFAGVPEKADYVAALLGGEEQTLWDAAKEIGFRRRRFDQSANNIELTGGREDLTAQSIKVRLDRVDSFLAGVSALGADHKSKVRNGFLATKGRKNKLRSLFIEFGRNRKHYFELLAEAGLMEEHNSAVTQLVSHLGTEIDAASQERTLTHHGMILNLLDNILSKLDLVEAHERPCSHLAYLHSLPILGSNLHGYKPLNTTYFQGEAFSPKASRPTNIIGADPRLPPVRITSTRRLLVEARVIEQLATDGSKLNGLTVFVRPNPDDTVNSFIAVPGNMCILLGSSICSTASGNDPLRSLISEILDSDPELPPMLWEERILLPASCITAQGVFIQNDELQLLRESMIKAFGECGSFSRGRMRYRRVNTGLRISTIRPHEKID